MSNFQETFKIRKRSFTCAFSICMTVPLTFKNLFTNILPKRKFTINVLSLMLFTVCITLTVLTFYESCFRSLRNIDYFCQHFQSHFTIV